MAMAFLIHDFGGGISDLESWLMHVACLFILIGALLSVLGLFWPKNFSAPAANVVAALGMLAFVWYFLSRFLSEDLAPLANAFEVLLLVGTVLLIGYYVWMAFKPQRHVDAWLFPLVFLITLSALLIGGNAGPSTVDEAEVSRLSRDPWLVAHIVFVVIAMAELAFASTVSCIYLLQDRTLRRKRDSRVLQSLPSLETLRRMIARVMTVGFPTMTLALVFGFVLVWHELDKWITTPVILTSMAMWLVFFLAALGRFSRVLGGRRMAWLVIVGFMLVIATYFGAGQMGGNHSFDATKNADQNEEAAE